MAGPAMPAPAPAHMGYYGVHPSHMYGLPDPNAMRFALAPGMAHDPRIALSGGRHKKVPTHRHSGPPPPPPPNNPTKKTRELLTIGLWVVANRKLSGGQKPGV